MFSFSRRVELTTAPVAHVAARLPPVPIDAEGRDSRIAVDDPDMLERHPHLIGGNLRQRRLVALPMRRLSGEHGEPAIGLEPDLRQLAAEHPPAHAHLGGPGCGFDEGRHPQTEIPALGAGSALLFAERFQIDPFERPIQ